MSWFGAKKRTPLPSAKVSWVTLTEPDALGFGASAVLVLEGDGLVIGSVDTLEKAEKLYTAYHEGEYLGTYFGFSNAKRAVESYESNDDDDDDAGV